MSGPSTPFLRQIGIKNFRCLRDVEVELGPFNVLVGPNDSGKTSFLKAIESLGNLAKGKGLAAVFPLVEAESFRFADALRDARGTGRLGFEAILSTDQGSLDYKLDLATDQEREIPWVLYEKIGPREKDCEQRRCVELEWEPQAEPSGSFTIREDGEAIETLSRYGSAVLGWIPRQYRALADAFSLLGDLVSYDLDPRAVTRPGRLDFSAELTRHGDQLASVIGNMKLAETDNFSRFITHFKSLSQERVIDVLCPLDPKDGTFHLKFRFATGAVVEAPYVSTGLLYLLTVMALIYGPKRHRLIMLEEPENGLHPARLEEVVKLLRQLSEGTEGVGSCQVIITTHSPYLLDHCKRDEVLVFRRRPDEWTTVDRIPEDLPRKSWGMMLGELWGFGGEDALIKGPSSPHVEEREIDIGDRENDV